MKKNDQSEQMKYMEDIVSAARSVCNFWDYPQKDIKHRIADLRSKIEAFDEIRRKTRREK